MNQINKDKVKDIDCLMLSALRITYSEAVDILKRSSETFVFPTDVSGSVFCFFYLILPHLPPLY